MKVQKIKLSNHEYGWLVLDDNYRLVKPITEFTKYLSNVDKSPFTLRSYAYHLKLYWEYLTSKNIDWRKVNLSELAGFVAWLRESEKDNNILDIFDEYSQRKPATINVILGCISSFYRFHNQLGNSDVQITESKCLPGNRYKSLLHHVFKNKPVQKRVISVKQPKLLPKTITQEQFILMTNSCTNIRDKFLVWLLYETGIRIGQALSLRHQDIICWDKVIHVIYRSVNINQVRNKSIKPNIINVSDYLMDLYTDYVNSLDQAKLQEYVFINLVTYQPLSYPAVRKLFQGLSLKSGFYIRPHMLRHTHATGLVDAGWDMSLIQKRLGHASIQTTIDTYTHIDTKQMKDAFKSYLSKMEDK